MMPAIPHIVVNIQKKSRQPAGKKILKQIRLKNDWKTNHTGIPPNYQISPGG